MFNFNNQGCQQGCPQACPTYNTCNQVVNKCYVQDVPHYTNYHTTVVNNCVRRHINIPTFTQSEEMVVTDQYVDGNPIYYNQAPMYQQAPIYQQAQYNMNPEFMQNPSMNMGQASAVNPNNPFNF